jgi:hypothetical protein
MLSVQVIRGLHEKIPDILEQRWWIGVDAAVSEPWRT